MKEHKTVKEFLIVTIDGQEGNHIVGINKVTKKQDKFMEQCYKRIGDRERLSTSLTIRTADNKFRFGMAKTQAGFPLVKLEGYDFVLVAENLESMPETLRLFGYCESYEWFDTVLKFVHNISGNLDLKYGMMMEAQQHEPDSVAMYSIICDRYVPSENMTQKNWLLNKDDTKN